MHLMTHLTVPNPKSQFFFPFSSASDVQHRFAVCELLLIVCLNEPSSSWWLPYSNRVSTDGAGWGAPNRTPQIPVLTWDSTGSHINASQMVYVFSLWKWLLSKIFRFMVAFKGEGLLISPSVTRSTFCLNLQLYNVYEKTNAALSSLLFVLNWKPVNSCFSGD